MNRRRALLDEIRVLQGDLRGLASADHGLYPRLLQCLARMEATLQGRDTGDTPAPMAGTAATLPVAPAHPELLASLFDNIHLLLAHLDRDFNFLRVNRRYAAADGRPQDFFPGKNHFALYPHAENEAIFRQVVASGTPYHTHARPFAYPDAPERGLTYWDWSLQPILDDAGHVTSLVLLLADVTETTRARQMRDRLAAIIEATPDLVTLATPDGRLLYMNAAGRAMLGVDAEEDITVRAMTEFLIPEERRRLEREILPTLATTGIWIGEAQLLHRDGHTMPVSQIRVGRRDEAGRLEFVGTIARDIGVSKRTEQRLRRLNRTYVVLSECSQTMVRADTEEELLEGFCRDLVVIGGYHFVWIGQAEQDRVRSVRPRVWCGEEAGYLETAQISWADTERGRGPVGTAIRSGQPVVARDLARDPHFAPWREAALKRGFHSMIALPLKNRGQVMGSLNLYSTDADAFDDEEVELLIGLVEDLGFALDALYTRAEQIEDRKLLHLRIKAIEASCNGIMITGREGNEHPLLYVNPAFEHITGYHAGDALGRDPRFLHGGDGDQPGLQQLRTAIRNCKPASVLMRNYRKDGSLFWNELHIAPVDCSTGTGGYFVGIINDVTAHKHYQQQLEYQATHDPLTALPNRALLADRLQHGIAQAQRHDRQLAVLLIDLDHFKLVNDSLGHAAGDAMLREVAARLKSCAREADTVAHMGGDEFIILMTDLEEANDAALLAERVMDTLAHPMEREETEVLLTASIGIALFPRDGNDVETLMRNAGAALHRTKELARNSFQFYTPELNRQAHDRIRLETLLRRALERDEFRLHYQPQVEMGAGRIVGAEALLRWENTELGMVPPARFISIAEDTGLIVPIGQWVLHEACRQAVAWQRAGLPPLTMAVNVSARQLASPHLIRDVERVLAMTGLAPAQLELELTESTVMSDPEAMLERLRALRQFGLQLALDDFGIGYSSLSHLQRFPFDRLKVDRSFIQDITSNPHNAAIVRTILAMAQGLNMRVIAEGAEQAAQVHFLRRLHCPQIQGYFFSMPLPAAEFSALLRGSPSFPLAPDAQDAPPTLLIVDDAPLASIPCSTAWIGKAIRYCVPIAPNRHSRCWRNTVSR